MTTKVKQITEINGVILTPEAIKALKNYQETDNEYLKYKLNTIAELVMFLEMTIFRRLDDYPNEAKECREHIINLIDIRNDIKHFTKP